MKSTCAKVLCGLAASGALFFGAGLTSASAVEATPSTAVVEENAKLRIEIGDGLLWGSGQVEVPTTIGCDGKGERISISFHVTQGENQGSDPLAPTRRCDGFTLPKMFLGTGDVPFVKGAAVVEIRVEIFGDDLNEIVVERQEIQIG